VQLADQLQFEQRIERELGLGGHRDFAHRPDEGGADAEGRQRARRQRQRQLQRGDLEPLLQFQSQRAADGPAARQQPDRGQALVAPFGRWQRGAARSCRKAGGGGGGVGTQRGAPQVLLQAQSERLLMAAQAVQAVEAALSFRVAGGSFGLREQHVFTAGDGGHEDEIDSWQCGTQQVVDQGDGGRRAHG
jgi:hypothetical protein